MLPSVPGLTGIYVRSINNQGWVAGFAGFPGTTTHAVVWKPNGNTYLAIDLGVLPGTTISEAVGIDNLGRVVGWSTTSNFPPNGSPFVWTESTGMLDLSAQGFPDDSRLPISPGGTVATASAWYQLDDPASVESLPPPPPGFTSAAIRPRSTTPETRPASLSRPAPRTWSISSVSTTRGAGSRSLPNGTGHLSTYGVGSINAARDVTATIQSTAVIALGPNGPAQSLAPLVSPAYPGATIGLGGPMNSAGQILTQVMIGRSQRLMKLTPASACRPTASR